MNSLELKQDGEYIHSYQESGSAKETLAGKWELERTRYGQVVSLDNFHSLPGKNVSGNEYYLLEPNRFFGSIRLVRNADLTDFYKKQVQ